LRGKKSKVKGVAESTKLGAKRKTSNEVTEKLKASPASKKVKIDLTEDDHIDLTQEEDEVEESTNAKEEDKKELDAMIDTSEKTDFQKKCLKLLIQIPEGHFSTYGESVIDTCMVSM